jgi:hypothetical protein
MKYLLLLYDDAAAVAALPAEVRRAIVDDHVRYAAMLREHGALLAGEPLDGPEAARTLRFDGADATVTDGPFLEAKEALGGFYVIEAPDEQAAVALAKQVPRSPSLVAELRPIADM